ncbi:phospho-sugar mutase [Oceanobacillus halophilus]|uniref:Phosphoglucomutase n=1 Tax=Oceanobacillus halophilus TaxID=930130 RepID=A0A494ZZH1_9BACI|nr:phospho-sugar mutase [Oceanobacillus halophilus]RKQ31511.1 phospho-sugar mutase [Oceanobacillus halophilus]
MSTWEQGYKKWDSFQDLDESLKLQLDSMKEEKHLLEDAFYKELTFGTGGMRGVLGPGTNRMNKYTVRKAVNGLASYLLDNRVNVRDRGVVIAYDSRYMSKEFAIEAAKVLGVYGIKTHVFDSIRPTPLLSFAVRYLSTTAGIMITASHNPPEYNGLKVYNENGSQITPDEAEQLLSYINQTKDELQVSVLEKTEAEEKALLSWIGDEIDNAYLGRLSYISRLGTDTLEMEKDVKIVFTPLHGSSYDLIMRGLKQHHFSNVHVVEEQVKADPEFSTVESPNPEEHQAFHMAMDLGEKIDADILLGTDPDGDRLGVAVKNKTGNYHVLTGNQLGSLLLDYVLRHSNPVIYQNARMIKTVVTTELGKAIADSYGVKTIDTLTGFKYIGEKINSFDSTGETFLFGFEESYGYLVSGYVRDKDAVQAAVMTAEMAYFWKQQGKTLLEALHDLYEKHGYYVEGMSSIELKGKNGMTQIEKIMDDYRETPVVEIAGMNVEKVENYLTRQRINKTDGKVERIQLPKENMIKFMLEDNTWVCIRPSGTEPKIKYYYGVCGISMKDSESKLSVLEKAMAERMEEMLSIKV